jgi:hypothetical protein
VAEQLTATGRALCASRPGRQVVVRARVQAPPETRRWLAAFGAPHRLVHAAREAAAAAGLPLWWERIELAARPGPSEADDAERGLDDEGRDDERRGEGHDGDGEGLHGDGAATDLRDAVRHAGARLAATARAAGPGRQSLAPWLGPETAAVAHALGELTGVDLLEPDDAALARARSLVLDLLGDEHDLATERP